VSQSNIKRKKTNNTQQSQGNSSHTLLFLCLLGFTFVAFPTTTTTTTHAFLAHLCGKIERETTK